LSLAAGMSYVVLARKWRPQSFEDLVGQEHVAHHARQRHRQGPRRARVLVHGGPRRGQDHERAHPGQGAQLREGPHGDAVPHLPACVEIARASDVDVQEIDGASYNGVDEVRRLQETLPYRPQRDRFKIYIVDEVHMLSNAAWNAFLKTLEEPPPHVKFIFATTEVTRSRSPS
jgi:DNA polymerase-3 subunit gamma/tau